MRRSKLVRYKMPKNMGVAPRYDMWNEKYEPWQHMKNMGRLAGTGFYIPPEWYNHFRMFPPIAHNFQQEKTLNPHNASEQTQDDTDTLSQERFALRDELARKSRLLASEGMRYYNIFWVQKPLDRMEKEYYALKRRGIAHDMAIKKVLQTFYDELAVKKRISHIQAEEAKFSGKFITMREATVVMNVLVELQKDQRTPHQVAEMANTQRRIMQESGPVVAAVSRKQVAQVPTTPASGESGTADSESPGDPNTESEADLESPSAGSGTQYVATVTECKSDTASKLRELATDGTGKTDWYTGISPFYDWEESSTPTQPQK